MLLWQSRQHQRQEVRLRNLTSFPVMLRTQVAAGSEPHSLARFRHVSDIRLQRARLEGRNVGLFGRT